MCTVFVVYNTLCYCYQFCCHLWFNLHLTYCFWTLIFTVCRILLCLATWFTAFKEKVIVRTLFNKVSLVPFKLNDFVSFVSLSEFSNGLVRNVVTTHDVQGHALLRIVFREKYGYLNEYQSVDIKVLLHQNIQCIKKNDNNLAQHQRHNT